MRLFTVLAAYMMATLDIAACDKCYDAFNWMSQSDKIETFDDEDIYWKGYLDGMRNAYLICRDIVRINHPECKE